MQSPTAERVHFEDAPLGSPGNRRARVTWSDGTESIALHWFDDEVLFCEGDIVGKSLDEIRALHHRRDRDFLTS